MPSAFSFEATSKLMEKILHCGSYRLSLQRPLIMAIVNVTPDSFSGDGLAGASRDVLLRRAEQAIADGADILDIGGESSRPGAASVSEGEEIARVLPAVEALAPLGVPLSIDTVKPGVMRAAIGAGASLINDINALREPGAIEAIAATDVGVCLMHMQGEPRTMQAAPYYGDVVTEVTAFLQARAQALRAAGVEAGRILFDPGFGFGKTLAHNLALLGELARIGEEYPLLIGVSRKSMLGQITGKPVGDRLAASIAMAMLAVQRGAAIVRVHDVAATRDALAVLAAAS